VHFSYPSICTQSQLKRKQRRRQQRRRPPIQVWATSLRSRVEPRTGSASATTPAAGRSGCLLTRSCYVNARKRAQAFRIITPKSSKELTTFGTMSSPRQRSCLQQRRTWTLATRCIMPRCALSCLGGWLTRLVCAQAVFLKSFITADTNDTATALHRLEQARKLASDHIAVGGPFNWRCNRCVQAYEKQMSPPGVTIAKEEMRHKLLDARVVSSACSCRA
jgi:hypothetical protein